MRISWKKKKREKKRLASHEIADETESCSLCARALVRLRFTRKNLLRMGAGTTSGGEWIAIDARFTRERERDGSPRGFRIPARCSYAFECLEIRKAE